MQSHRVDPNHLARTPAELRTLLSSGADWIVRQKSDFHRLRDAGHPALKKLSDADFTAFADSLTFKDGALVGGTYKPLMGLTKSEVHDVLHRFGGRIPEMLAVDFSCAGGECQSDPFGLCGTLTCRHAVDHPPADP